MFCFVCQHPRRTYDIAWPVSYTHLDVYKRQILDGIIEMIYALDKIAPGTANDDTLLYGVEAVSYTHL